MHNRITHHFSLQHFNLEINEQYLNRNDSLLTELMQSLRKIEVHIVLSNYKATHLSLFELNNYPISKIKLSPELLAKPDNAVVLKTFVDVAHSFNLACVADGIQSQTQYELLKNLGCDALQGQYVETMAKVH